jgi:hypothetical protein
MGEVDSNEARPWVQVSKDTLTRRLDDGDGKDGTTTYGDWCCYVSLSTKQVKYKSSERLSGYDVGVPSHERQLVLLSVG